MHVYVFIFYVLGCELFKISLKKSCLDHAAVFIVIVSFFITIEFSSPEYQFVWQSGHSKCIISNHYLKGYVDFKIR